MQEGASSGVDISGREKVEGPGGVAAPAGPAGGAGGAGSGAGDELATFLEALSAASGVCGHEAEVARIVEQGLGPYSDQLRRDRLGNVIARLGPAFGEDAGGPAPRVMLAAHMDEVGMLVLRIEKGGFLRVAPMGGTNVQTLLGHEVRVHTAHGPLAGVVGLKPPHLLSREERERFPKWDELFVDTGLEEPEVRSRVQVGDPVTLAVRPVTLLGGRMAGKALDNRVGVAVLREALRNLRLLRHRAEVYAVATVQEEVGLRGAVVSTFGLVPDVGVAVDVTFARQRLVHEPDVVELGRGPAVAMGPNMHPVVSRRLLEVARAHGVPHQLEVIPGRSGTDAWAMQVSRSGVATGLVSVPLRYMHSPVEVVQLDDIRHCGRLLAHFVASLDPDFIRTLADWGVNARGVQRDGPPGA